MQLTDFVRGVPDDVWAVFEPALPPVRNYPSSEPTYPTTLTFGKKIGESDHLRS
jgi:hypothetical protein